VSELRDKIAETREAVRESIALADRVGMRLRSLTDANVALRHELLRAEARYERLVEAVRESGDADLLALVEDGV